MIKGLVKNSKGKLLNKAVIELKDESFKTILTAYTDENGYFEIKRKSGFYPYMTVVKDYCENYLEFWGLNIDLKENYNFEITIGTNEIYGLNVFEVNGSKFPIFIYFRPMNLLKYKNGETDISPNIEQENINVMLDGVESKLFKLQKVNEYIEVNGQYLTSFLIQLVEKKESWNNLEIKIIDKEYEVGQAIIFNRKEKSNKLYK